MNRAEERKKEQEDCLLEADFGKDFLANFLFFMSESQ